MSIDVGAAYELDPQVALRPEPFGSLAYHFGNRRLSFLRSPEVTEVVRTIGEHPSVADALAAAGIPEDRWPAFLRALDTLESSEMIRAR